jgi:hypothetical protein
LALWLVKLEAFVRQEAEAFRQVGHQSSQPASQQASKQQQRAPGTSL